MRVHVRRWEGQLVSCGGGLEIIGDIWDKIYVKMSNRVCFWKENMSLTWQDIWKHILNGIGMVEISKTKCRLVVALPAGFILSTFPGPFHSKNTQS